MDDIDFSQYLFQGEAEVKDNLSDNLLVNNTIMEDNDGTQLETPIDFGEEVKSIFFTINPADYYWKEKYGMEITEDVFRHMIITEFNKLSDYYKKHKQIKMDIHIHFEKTNGRVHCHGVIVNMPIAYYPFQGELDRMSKMLHKTFGKPRLRHNIAADFRWCNNVWTGKYLVKQNYLKPCRIVYE